MENYPNYITKIEGHGLLKIDFSRKQVKLVVEEGERYIEALLIGRPYSDAAYITSRICGVCPTAHTLAAVKAVENGFGIKLSKTILALRRLMQTGQWIQSHALHLFFLAMPDYLHIDSVLEMSKKYPREFALGIALKQLGDEIQTQIGGRAVHPLTPVVGGFSKYPSRDELWELKSKLLESLPKAVDAAEVFAQFKHPEIDQPALYMALRDDEHYPGYSGVVWTSDREGFDAALYREKILEEVVSGSSAKQAKTKKGQSFIVGAIARISLFPDLLNRRAKLALQKSGIEFPSQNRYLNNYAQAIEIIHSIEESIKIIDEILEDYRPENINYLPKEGLGVGVVEAPRGLLYHAYKFDSSGQITWVDIITPTVQNLTSIEVDAKKILAQADDLEEKQKEHLIEMLIRAYDPCITCSVH